MKRVLAILLALFLAVRIADFLNDDFRLQNITMEGIPHVYMPTSENDQMASLFNQPFYYLGKGSQTYVFRSSDDTYVLKLFKFKHLKTPFQAHKKQKKLLNLFNGYKIAFLHDPKYTGLLFIHLSPTNHLGWQVKLFDKIGNSYTLPLDNYYFILQKKGETLSSLLTQLLNHSQIDEAAQKLGQIFDMYLDEYHASLYDSDHGVMPNIGFADGAPFHLDAGNFMQDPSYADKSFYLHDIQGVAVEIKLWLENNFPSMAKQLVDLMERHLTSKLGENIDLRAFEASQKRF